MKYAFFTNSEKTWTAMLESITNAQESIYLEMYIFEDHVEKFDFFTILEEKARKGLRVRLVLDFFGSMNLSNAKIFEMKDAGVEILFLSYFLHHTHRKILIIDEKIAYIGGANVHRMARLWNDLVIKIQGNLVKNLVKSFAKAYILAGGTDTILLARQKEFVLQKFNAWVIDHNPLDKNSLLRKVYAEEIKNARESILLVTPYFMPQRWLRGALHQAVLRGVKVEILLPKVSNSMVMNRVNYFYMHRLSKFGIIFHLEPKMNHAKAMIIDSDKAMVGSPNLDFFSFDLNAELGVFFKEPEIVKQLLMIVETWKHDSEVFNPETFRPRWFDYIISPLMKLFSKVF